MNICIKKLLAGAKSAKGLAVIIDVFRAFSTCCYIFANNAKNIIVTDNIEIAFKLKQNHPEYFLIGERDGKKIKNFDFGNSPYEIQEVDFTERTVILTTSAGTKGLINASNAEKIITGSFVNADAIIKYIKNGKFKNISLVAMGNNGKVMNREDLLCARYLKKKLQNKKVNYDKDKLESILKQNAGSRFFNRSIKDSYPQDFYLSIDINKFDFVVEAERIKKDIFLLKNTN
ncbi:MAG: 2-phosphosulfolactate phosphatase [Candidatus Mcinerneyibacterium aminivorans]|uniref:Probable 2-phosphosulfolactate phosphatase n=1 Tax=Candidatus Mcinerneyibacterium aminivorans TaxID=2703815 RepID=A0A5D0MH05_9BACT|nr:MAG: 2-phosphosulfolactate phosphatase [Candidatus Mcinerneyibacterium aminivorans]